MSKTIIDLEKLKEAVWFVISHRKPEIVIPSMLYNILYFSDKELFAREGRPLLTEPEHMEQTKDSAVSRHLDTAINDLASDGSISGAVLGYYTSIKEFRRERLTDSEIALLTEFSDKELVAVDQEKLKEAVWFIVFYGPPQEIENITLHKILYYSDIECYRRQGRPLVDREGESPVIKYLASAISDLLGSGAISVSKNNRYAALKYFSRERLTESEISIIEGIADAVLSGAL